MMSDSATWSRTAVVQSETWPGVEIVISKMTYGRRLDLMRRIRDLAARAEFLEAGVSGKDRMDASLLGAEIDRLYVQWGVEEVRGIDLNGQAATPAALIEIGPEDLFREAHSAVKAISGLNENERKN